MKAMAMAGNEELYSRFGCPAGIFVNKIDKGSIASYRGRGSWVRSLLALLLPCETVVQPVHMNCTFGAPDCLASHLRCEISWAMVPLVG